MKTADFLRSENDRLVMKVCKKKKKTELCPKNTSVNHRLSRQMGLLSLDDALDSSLHQSEKVKSQQP